MSEVLLGFQGLSIFLLLKTVVTEKILLGDAQGPMGVSEVSYTMTMP